MDDDHEVMFSLEMALEQDQRHQALALNTWMPRIKLWLERAEQAEAQLRDSEPPGSRHLVEIDRLTQENWRLTQRIEQAEAKAREDAKDAARYRWLRVNINSYELRDMRDFCPSDDELDAAIDAAITERGDG